jgi:hypothetical protein
MMETDENGEMIRKVYPDLNDEELRQAKNNIDDYLQVVLKIYKRITSDPTSALLLKELLRRKNRQK